VETAKYGAKFFVPFSSMHKYQRSDSIWGNAYTTEVSDYKNGFRSKSSEVLSAFVQYDCARDLVVEINPPKRPILVYKPQDFGDDWGEQLEQPDRSELSHYFR